MDELLEFLFQEAGRDAIASARGAFELIEASDGQVILEVGQPGTHAFIVIDGDLDVRIGGVQLATLHSGTMVGELGLFGHEPRTARVTTITPVTLLGIDRPSLLALQADENPIATILEIRAIHTTVSRLREAQSRLARLSPEVAHVEAPKDGGLIGWFKESFGLVGRRSGAGLADRVSALRALPAFAEADATVVETLAKEMSTLSFRDGEIICREGDEADEMYLLAHGHVKVLQGALRYEAGRIEPGTLFGVGSMLEDGIRNATCAAIGDTTVMTLSGESWRKLSDATSRLSSGLRSAMVAALAVQIEEVNQALRRREGGKTLSHPGSPQRVAGPIAPEKLAGKIFRS